MSEIKHTLGAQLVDASGGDTIPILEPGGARVVGIGVQGVAELGNLVSRMNDMGEVIAYCDAYMDALGRSDNSEEIRRALWKSAVASYGRAFSHDSRRQGKLDLKALAGLPGHPLVAHQYFIALRNKFVAHSDSTLEEVKVGAVLGRDEPPRITGLYVVHAAAQLLDDEGAAVLRRLANAFIEWAQRRSTELQAGILAGVQSLDPAPFYAQPDLTYEMPMADALITFD